MYGIHSLRSGLLHLASLKCLITGGSEGTPQEFSSQAKSESQERKTLEFDVSPGKEI